MTETRSDLGRNFVAGPDKLFDVINPHETAPSTPAEAPGSSEVVSSEPERPPIVVGIAERALALADIMAFYNKDNQVAGSATQMSRPGSKFVQRYKERAADVQSGARASRNVALEKFRAALHVLNATDAMQAYQHQPGDPKEHPDGMGYIDDDNIDLSRISLQKDLRERLARPGEVHAAERRDVVDRAVTAAEYITQHKLDK